MSEALTWDEARRSPCRSCAAPCCTVLPLYDFAVRSLPDLDYALYLLNFDRIELALMEDGQWRAHYRAPCRNLDLETRGCRVHSTPDQPAVCQKYDAQACFYRPIFSESGYGRMVRMDRGRVEAWASGCRFNDLRELVAAPPHDGLLDWLPPMAPVPDSATPPELPPDPVMAAWRALARGEATPEPAAARSWAELRQPCDGCAAWCCAHLSFPHGTPQNASQVDHLRFALGFPGVEVGVDAAGNWTLEVRTRCRHLVDTVSGGRCGVFGQEERPGVCRRYDAMSCAYRGRLSRPRPAGAARVTADAFDSVAAGFAFDAGGAVIRRPDLTEIVARVEAAWASADPA